ncbi:hypothetical protein PHYC_03989 [Phycisphaerales bacterium]|nr:hypothetical protein PHYC_03989 [Phycisphaerales bacterium]
MILIDAGPLIAGIDRSDLAHAECARVLGTLPDEGLATWPVFAEAMHMLGRRKGRQGPRSRQQVLWAMLDAKDLHVLDMDQPHIRRAKALMHKYREFPMDLCDASLVVVGEALNIRRVFTLDRHFAAYRLNSKTPFEIVPDVRGD